MLNLVLSLLLIFSSTNAFAGMVGGDHCQDAFVYLTKDGATPVGDNKAVSGHGTDWSTSEVTATYGGPTDLWGTTWTASEINASTFGSLFSWNFVSGGGFGLSTAYIDVQQITVDYTEASGARRRVSIIN